MCQHNSVASTRATNDEASGNWTINDIVRHFGPAYLDKYRDRMSLDQLKAMRVISHCRTPAAGSILLYCRGCAKVHHVPKSCGNRHCPSCQGAKAKDWLEKQQARLLPCAYFMMTFTLPAEIRLFVRSHPRKCYDAILEAAYQSLSKLAEDPKYLGSGKVGATAVLHTWGRDLNYHPHVHFIVPGGALGATGKEWLSSRSDFLVPVRALSKIFRAKFKALMLRHGLLGQIDPIVWERAWNVDCQAVGDGRDSLKYLAPYVYRVAIGNHRIKHVKLHADGTGEVTFLVKPSGQRSYRPMTVSAEEFIRRLMQHVLPRGFQKIRHYGFMHKRSKVPISWLAMLVTITLNMVYTLVVGPRSEMSTRPKARCSACGSELECLGCGARAILKLKLIMLDSS